MLYSGNLYKCSAGETFDGIALAVYKNEKYACDLMAANPWYVMKTMFEGGELLALPIVEAPEQDGEEEYTSAVAPWKER